MQSPENIVINFKILTYWLYENTELSNNSSISNKELTNSFLNLKEVQNNLLNISLCIGQILKLLYGNKLIKQRTKDGITYNLCIK